MFIVAALLWSLWCTMIFLAQKLQTCNCISSTQRTINLGWKPHFQSLLMYGPFGLSSKSLSDISSFLQSPLTIICITAFRISPSHFISIYSQDKVLVYSILNSIKCATNISNWYKPFLFSVSPHYYLHFLLNDCWTASFIR